MGELNKFDVIRQLFALDKICKREDVHLRIALFGAASLLFHLEEDSFRRTIDIDFRLEHTSSREKFEKIKQMMPGMFEELIFFPEFPDQELYQINGETVKSWKGHLFENLTIFLPSIEMIALSKLMSKRQKDLDDLLESPILNKCDLVELKEYVEEAATYLSNTTEYNYLEWDNLLTTRGLSLS